MRVSRSGSREIARRRLSAMSSSSATRAGSTASSSSMKSPSWAPSSPTGCSSETVSATPRASSTPPPVELLHRPDQPQIPFLDEVEEVDARGAGIAAGVGHHQAQVGSQEVILGLPTLPLQPLQLDLLGLAFPAALLAAGVGAV